MHVKEAVISQKDLHRFADGLLILKEQAESAWEQDRMVVAISILRAMAESGALWSVITTEDLEALRREAGSE